MSFSLAARLVQRNFTKSTLNVPYAALGTHGVPSRDVVPLQTPSANKLEPPVYTLAADIGFCKNRSEVILNESSPSPTSAKDSRLSGIFSKLSLLFAEMQLTKEYVLPSILPSYHSDRAILDPSPQAHVRECPTINPQKEIVERPLSIHEKRIDIPINPHQPIVEKQARRILKIRRKKMKKHQYQKWKKRNKFKLRAMFAKRRKKKRKLWEEHLEGYLFKGLTSEYTDWYLDKKKEDAAIFLRHLGIHVEDETQESIEAKEKRQKLKAKKTTVYLDPMGSMKVIPTPILPEGSSLKIALQKEEELAELAREQTVSELKDQS